MLFWRVSTRGQIIYLRKTNDLCKRKLFYFFRSFLSSFFWKRRKKANQRKKKKQVRPFPENSLKKHERILGTGDCRECSRKCVFSFLLTQNGWKSRKVCYVCRKSGLKSQADRSVRKADSAGRLDSYVRTNKAFEGVGVPRGRGRIASQRFTLTLSNILPWQNIQRWHRLCSLSFCVSPWPIWFLSGDAERNIKKKLKFIKISVFLKH